MWLIELVPFGDMRSSLLDGVVMELEDRFRSTVVIEDNGYISDQGFDQQRNQYLAGAFLDKLRELGDQNKTKRLGVTGVDIYSMGLNYVFGQALVGGTAGIISTARLVVRDRENRDGGNLLEQRILKEAVHELGHTFGLAHCEDKNCVMRLSHGLPDTDLKSAEFCERHQAQLQIALG